MRFVISSILALTLSFTASATDIFVADIVISKIAPNQNKLHNIKNITNRQGYDNQPMFSQKLNGLYYTAMFNNGTKENTTQADIMFYDFDRNKQHNVTKTQDVSEYSPTEVNKQNALSMIIVEPDGTQRLWATHLSKENQSKKQTLINQSIKPVGYHSWGKQQDLILFVLGEPMTLQYVSNPEQSPAKLIASNVGRSLHYNAPKDLFFFSIEKDKEE